VYLPSGYHASGRRFPVLYLLHGYTDDESAWIQFGEIDRIADQEINTGQVPPMIIVMPDAGVTWYMNDFQNKYRYEDMFIEEFIPFIDATYATRPSREFRALSGLSMGGHGSLILAMRHTDMFTACAALSAAVFTDNQAINKHWTVEHMDKVIDLKLEGKKRLNDHWKANNAMYLAQSKSIDDIKKVRWYIDCGDDDFLYEGNSMLHILLRDLEIPHEYRVRNGGHSWSYWRTGIVDCLGFIGESFRR